MRAVLFVVAVAMVSALPARAQWDNGTQQSLNRINAAIARDRRGSNIVLQNYVRQNYPRLREEYFRSGAAGRMSFMQFSYRELLSHATIRPNNNALAQAQAAHQAQVDRFNARQAAHVSQSAAGETLIRSGQSASDANTGTIERSTQGSIRGNSAYVNPQTGAPQYMPSYAPGYSRASDGTLYRQDRDGRYYQQQGSGWVPVQGR